MEDYYFIPVLDENVGRIFSDNSISPPAFYTNRQMGALDYFFHKEIRFPINYNLAYNGIDELIKSSNENRAKSKDKSEGDTSGYFVFFGFPSKYFKDEPKWKFGDVEVIKVSKTLYLNPQEYLIVCTNSHIVNSRKYLKRNSYYEKEIRVSCFSLESSQRDELLDDSLPNEEAKISYKRNLLLNRFIEGFAVGSALKAGKNVLGGCLWIKTFLNKAKLFENLGKNIHHKIFYDKINDSQVNSFILEEIERLRELIQLIDEYIGAEDALRVSLYSNSNSDNSSGYLTPHVKNILELYLSRIQEVSKYRHIRYKFNFHRDEIDSYNNELLRGFENGLNNIVSFHSSKIWSSVFWHESPFVFDENQVRINNFSSYKEKMIFQWIVNELISSCIKFEFPLTKEEKQKVLKDLIDKIHSLARDFHPEDLKDLEQLRLHFYGEVPAEFKKIKNNVFQALYFIYEDVFFTCKLFEGVYYDSFNVEAEYELFILETLVYYFPLKAILDFDNYTNKSDMNLFVKNPEALNMVNRLKYSLVGFDFESQGSKVKAYSHLITMKIVRFKPGSYRFI